MANQPLLRQSLAANAGARLEDSKVIEIDDDILLAERILESTQIRHALREAILTALKVRRHVLVSGAGLLALLAAAGGLSQAGAGTSSHACARLACPRIRL